MHRPEGLILLCQHARRDAGELGRNRVPSEKLNTQGDPCSSPVSRTLPNETLSPSVRVIPLTFSEEEGTVNVVVEPSVSTTLMSKSTLPRTTGTSVRVNGPAFTSEE